MFCSDGIMVFWNSPEDEPEHFSKACECALKMETRLLELNERWRVHGYPDVVARIGVNTGSVLSGNIGSPTKMKCMSSSLCCTNHEHHQLAVWATL